MMNTKEELQVILAEYRLIEEQLEYLEQQKQILREKIRGLLEGEGRNHYFLVVDNEPVALDLKEHTEVRYNETLLRQRLGPRYVRILAPDLKKIRQHLQEITPALTPYLDRIGAPSRDIIKQLILSGEFSTNEFQGTFKKIQKTTLYVRKPQVEGFDGNTLG